MSRKVALLVAEKPSVARSIARFLSQQDRPAFRQGVSKYNPLYEFNSKFGNRPYLFRVTSVSGHIMQYSFLQDQEQWSFDSIEDLFEAKVVRQPAEYAGKVIENLKAASRDIQTLILWLDCDREGEAIAFDVIEQCLQAAEAGDSVDIHRAHFSALTLNDINTAMTTLTAPNKNLSDGVRVRTQLDLKVGSTFTQFQTLLFG